MAERPDITIPEEAIEAGARALTEITGRPWANCLPGTRKVLIRNAATPIEAAAPLIVAAELERLVRVLKPLWPDPFGQFSAEQAHAARVMKQSAFDALERRAAELRGGAK